MHRQGRGGTALPTNCCLVGRWKAFLPSQDTSSTQESTHNLTRIGASLRGYENGCLVTNKNYLCKDAMADGPELPPTSAVGYQHPGPTPTQPQGFSGKRHCNWGEPRAGGSTPQAQPRDEAAAAPCHGLAQGRRNKAAAPRAELDLLRVPGLAMNQPFAISQHPCTAAPVHAAAPHREEDKEQLHSRASPPAASVQQVCQASVLSQRLVSFGQYQFLPASYSSQSLQHSRDRLRAPPREEEEAMQRQRQQQAAWGCCHHVPHRPQCYTPHQLGVPTSDTKPPTQGQEP